MALKKLHGPLSDVIMDYTSLQSLAIEKEFWCGLSANCRSFRKEGVVANATTQDFLLTARDIVVQPSAAFAWRCDSIIVAAENLNGLFDGSETVL